jgi:hypothetical protein
MSDSEPLAAPATTATTAATPTPAQPAQAAPSPRAILTTGQLVLLGITSVVAYVAAAATSSSCR